MATGAYILAFILAYCAAACGWIWWADRVGRKREQDEQASAECHLHAMQWAADLAEQERKQQVGSRP